MQLGVSSSRLACSSGFTCDISVWLCCPSSASHQAAGAAGWCARLYCGPRSSAAVSASGLGLRGLGAFLAAGWPSSPRLGVCAGLLCFWRG